MARKKINVKGIQRNVPESTVDDGACEEVINLRYRDAAWRPIGKKKKVAVTPKGYDNVWVHKGNDYEHFIAIKGTEAVWFDKETGAIKQRIDIGEKIYSVEFVGNLAVFMGETKRHTYLFYENEYVDIDDVELPHIYIKADKGRAENIVENSLYIWESVDKQKVLGRDSAALSSFRATLRGMYDSATSERNKKGFFEGHFLLCYAFRLYDGNYVKVSPISYHYFADKETVEIPGRFNDPSVSLLINESNGLVSLIARLAGIRFVCSFGNVVSKEDLEKIYKSIDIFITKPVSNIDFDSISSIRNPLGNGRSDIKKVLFEEKLSFYKVHSIPIKDAPSILEETIVFDENTLTTNPTLPTDIFYQHIDTGSVSATYNNRLLLGNVLTTLFLGYDASYFVQEFGVAQPSGRYAVTLQVELEKDGNKKIYSKTVYTDNDRGFVFNPTIGYPDSDATALTVVIVDTVRDMTFVKRFPLTASTHLNYAYYFNDKTDVITENYNMGITVNWVNYGKPILTMESSDVYLPVPFNFESSDTTVVAKNKVKISELNNPLVYPTGFTELVGKGEVLGFANNSVALSQGQFGQYPLFVFTEEGIWAMEQGSGDVLYKSITPLNREVCNRSSSITQLDRATVFTTDKGLLLIRGAEVVELSLPIEGVPERLQKDNVTYGAAVDNVKLVGLLSEHSSVPFKTYLAEAVFGYDYANRELLVGNPSYSYSYVFSLQDKIWYKAGVSYRSFINNYPKTLGVTSEGVVDVAVEDSENVAVLFQTKAIKLETESYKAVRRIILRGMLNTTKGKWSGFYVFGSYDAAKWAYLGGVQNKDEFRDMVVKTLRTDCKYFKFVFAGEVSTDSYLTYLELENMYEEQGRLR